MRPFDLPWLRWIGLAVGVLSVVLLFSLLVMAIDHAQEQAVLNESKRKLKDFGIAFHNHYDVFRSLPPGGVFTEDGQGLYGWPISLIPFTECTDLYDRLDLEQPWNAPANLKLLATARWQHYTVMPDAEPKMDKSGVELIHYAANPVVFNRNSRVAFEDLQAGFKHNWFLGEAAGDYPPWPSPTNWRPLEAPLNSGPGSYGRPTGDGAQFLMGDGSVRFVTNAAWKDL
jgi:hypothetical protein